MNSAEQHTSVDHPLAKILTAWLAALGIASWSDFASFLAAMYTLILICEWCWKKCGRPFCEARGWIKRFKRRADDR